MKIWIDLANSPHVPFFLPLIAEFEKQGHEVLITARDFAQTIPLAERYGLKFEKIGEHGGRKLTNKFNAIFSRSLELRNWAKDKKIDLAVSHNSYSQILSAFFLRIKSVTMMDYEHQPANHLAFRLSARIIVPKSFPDNALKKFGASNKKVVRYDGIKEDVYLADFSPNLDFQEILNSLGVSPEEILIVIRPPARDALYHRFENNLFDKLLEKINLSDNVKVIFLARTAEQKEVYSQKLGKNFILPEIALDGANLISSADLVISAGGTMNREAAALGVPCATIYAGEWAAIDEKLVKDKKMARLETVQDIENLEFAKKGKATFERNLSVKDEVVKLILNSANK